MTSPATGLQEGRNILLIFLLTVVFCGFAVWMVVPAPPVGFYWDDTWYLVMAEWFSGRTEHRELVWNMLHLRQYPPLFPLALSVTGNIFANPQNAFIVNALFLVAASAVAMVWFMRENFSAATTAIAAVLVVFNPVALFWLPTLFSEHLFILLTISALVLATSNREWRGLWLVIGVITALAVATRSAGWALLAGMLVHLVLGRQFLPLSWFAAGSIAGLLGISFLKAGLPPSLSYLDILSETADRLDWEYMVHQVSALISGWRSLWGSGVGGLIAAVMVIPGLLIRLKMNRPDAWFVMAYVGMLIAWPFPDHMSRFLWPAMPAFLVAGHASMALFGKQKIGSMIAGIALALIFVASATDGIGRTLSRLIAPPSGELTELSRMPEWTRSDDRKTGLEILQTRRQFLDDMQQISALTADNVCVYSELSALVTAQARRSSLASPWNSLDRVEMMQIHCPYYYLIPAALPDTESSDVDRFGTAHEEIFRSMAPYDPDGKQILGVFFRLRPTAAETK